MRQRSATSPARFRLVAMIALLALVGGCSGPSLAPAAGDAGRASVPAAGPSGTATTSSAAKTAISHVVVVLMENEEAAAVTASSMPYLYGLSQTYGRADRYFAVAHSSQPNYLALWSGSTHGIADDGTYDLDAPSLSSEATDAGRTWRIYAQDYPTDPGCHTAASYDGGVDGPGAAGTYARKHIPAMSFISVTGGDQCANVQPLAKFDPGVNVALVVPNLCNDMHDCSMATGDAFLRAFLPSVLKAPDWAHTLLVVSFDEGTSSVHGGGQVFTMVARQGLSGFVSSTLHDHYGLLRTIEDIFGLPCIEHSCDAAPLNEFLP